VPQKIAYFGFRIADWFNLSSEGSRTKPNQIARLSYVSIVRREDQVSLPSIIQIFEFFRVRLWDDVFPEASSPALHEATLTSWGI
jgi:hypothetical protein